jgi:ubiquinone/menaquinone biosynthesis C-methylase UbiE
MTKVIDAEGTQIGAIRRLADFRDQRVLEIGCGDGRLTLDIAREATSVLAVEPNEDEIATARATLPRDLADTVTYRVASAGELEIPSSSIDLVFFSWSL